MNSVKQTNIDANRNHSNVTNKKSRCCIVNGIEMYSTQSRPKFDIITKWTLEKQEKGREKDVSPKSIKLNDVAHIDLGLKTIYSYMLWRFQTLSWECLLLRFLSSAFLNFTSHLMILDFVPLFNYIPYSMWHLSSSPQNSVPYLSVSVSALLAIFTAVR